MKVARESASIGLALQRRAYADRRDNAFAAQQYSRGAALQGRVRSERRIRATHIGQAGPRLRIRPFAHVEQRGGRSLLPDLHCGSSIELSRTVPEAW